MSGMRPDPNALLNQIEDDERRSRRGRLKIFFGSSAGVGKTYAMLTAARRQLAEGVDVIAGVIETHGRTETQALCEGLPFLPQKEVTYRGVTLQAFDLDAAAKRRPALILIDELAHTNAPGSRHPKRWQDVEELLADGIDVYTTLNVQHLESLNDIVERITGVAVQETVPDGLFDEADEVVLVDTPPDELLQRLRDGKVYIAPGANDRAIDNFFRKTNLLSLRELALRRMADHVDADTDDERLRQGMTTQNIAGDRLLVCVGADGLAIKLVRLARRLSTSFKAPWTVLYVERQAIATEQPRTHRNIQRILQGAERNGARIVSLQSDRVGEEIIAYARTHGITKIIVGHADRPAWRLWLRPRLVDYLIRQSGDIDIYVVTGQPALLGERRQKAAVSYRELGREIALSVATVAGLTAIGWALRGYLGGPDMITIYLAGSVMVAVRLGQGATVLYTLLSAACLNFFFIPPIFSFTVYDRSYWLTFAVMLLASLVIASQASRLKLQTVLSRRRERNTQIFYGLTKALTVMRSRADIVTTVIRHVDDTLGFHCAVWLSHANDTPLTMVGGRIQGDAEKEQTVARWCFVNGREAGLGTDTLPSASGLYLPLPGTNRVYGVLAVYPPDGETVAVEDNARLETFSRLLASALERVQAAELTERSRIDSERERLRGMLLSSVSHDLRTPLAAIAGAAETLEGRSSVGADAAAKGLVSNIGNDARRLSRIIGNILEITRYESGDVQLNLQPYLLEEIVGNAVAASQLVLSRHGLKIDLPPSLPLVMIDGTLIQQLLVNLLENAARHTPPATQVTIGAQIVAEKLRIMVTDNGPGVPPGREADIFTKFATFQRGDQPKGTGLGLAICQAIAEAHGGRVWARNQPSGGCQVAIDLPVLLEENAV